MTRVKQKYKDDYRPRYNPHGDFPPAPSMNAPRIPVNLVMSAEKIHSYASHAVFIAVILDPETGKPLDRVPIYKAQPGEVVELAIERKTIFPGQEDLVVGGEDNAQPADHR